MKRETANSHMHENNGINFCIISFVVAAELCNTVVVSELRYVTKSLLHQVSNTGMKLVSTEWIVQSLIYGKARTDYAKFSLK